MLVYNTPAVVTALLMSMAWESLSASQLVNCGTIMMTSATMTIRTAKTFTSAPLPDVGLRPALEPDSRDIVWYRIVIVQNHEHRHVRDCRAPHRQGGRSERSGTQGGGGAGRASRDGRPARRSGRLWRRPGAAGRRGAARRLGRRRRRHQRRHLLHRPRPRLHDGREPVGGGPAQRGDPGRAGDGRRARPPAAASSTRSPRPTTSAAPPTGPTARPPQVRRLAARRRARRRPTTWASTSRSPFPTRPPIRARTTTRSPCASSRSDCTAICPGRGCAATCSSTRHRRRRAQHRRAGGHPLPRSADRGAARPARAHQVRQPTAGR